MMLSLRPVLGLRAFWKIGDISLTLEEHRGAGGPGRSKRPNGGTFGKRSILKSAGISKSTAGRAEGQGGPPW